MPPFKLSEYWFICSVTYSVPCVPCITPCVLCVPCDIPRGSEKRNFMLKKKLRIWWRWAPLTMRLQPNFKLREGLINQIDIQEYAHITLTNHHKLLLSTPLLRRGGVRERGGWGYLRELASKNKDNNKQ